MCLRPKGPSLRALGHTLSYADLWRSANYQVWKTDGAITQIFTDQGIVGIGEGTPYEGPNYIKEYTETVIRPLLIGKNPFDVELLANRGNDNRHNCAPWAGTDIACWDIIGKAKGLPVYQLLATDFEPSAKIKIYASAGVEHEWYNNGENFSSRRRCATRRKVTTPLSFAAAPTGSTPG